MAKDANRLRVNVFLAAFLPLVIIDASHPVSDFHRKVREGIDFALDVSGLWQGPWKLFAPDVDKANFRLVARIVFDDAAVSEWRSPDWTRYSALRKFAKARHMNYYGNTINPGQEPAWGALTEYLARSTPHPQGVKGVAVAAVELSLIGAIIPPPNAEAMLPARPYSAFERPQLIHVWRAGP